MLQYKQLDTTEATGTGRDREATRHRWTMNKATERTLSSPWLL